MAGRIFKFLTVDSVYSMHIRHKYSRGKPPTIARSLQQRIAELEYKDPAIYYKVDIGFSLQQTNVTQLRKAVIKELRKQKNDPEMEKLARHNKLEVNLDKINEDWSLSNSSQDIYKSAKHYGIYDDLYGDAYFYPVLPIIIDYDFGKEDVLARVHRGNVIESRLVKDPPMVHYTSDPDALWTLLMTTPDGNFTDPQYEYCHWFIGNIPGNDIAKGEQIIDYLRPIPARGIGYCRYIFILYKQDKKIDFSEYKKEQSCVNLFERNWKTYDFMRKHEDYVTPAALAFFQANYDTSLKDFYYNTLKMEEPIFEYDFPKPYIKKQVWYPKKQPFNLYMDKYRDPKQINKEYLLKKLKKEHPFKFPDPPLKYPNAYSIDKDVPSWYKTEIKKERLSLGRINDYK